MDTECVFTILKQCTRTECPVVLRNSGICSDLKYGWCVFPQFEIYMSREGSFIVCMFYTTLSTQQYKVNSEDKTQDNVSMENL